MRDRIRVEAMIGGNDRMGEVLGASVEIQNRINATLPEGLCLLSDRVLAIGQKPNTHSVTSVPLW